METITIENYSIGKTYPCFVVAEIGINHNGNTELAKKTIDAAVAAGANAVKFQNYSTQDFISNNNLLYEYISQGKKVVESQYEMFKRCELRREDLRDLRDYCLRRSINFHSTPTSQQGIEDLVDLGVSVLKNGSDYLTHTPLISSMGQTGLPTVLSTGMATLAEIDDAVRAFRTTGNNRLILLHCTSSYPTPCEEVNLRKIPTLEKIFDCLVGFSDHTEGITAAIGAVVLGACWIEKHFTLDKNLPGPDHRFSSNPEELESLVREVRVVEENLGQSIISPSKSEELGRRNFRLSCVAAKNLLATHRLSEHDIIFQRPGTGLPPKAKSWLLGRELAHNVSVGHVFIQGDFK